MYIINVVRQVSWYSYYQINTCAIKILSNIIIKFVRALKKKKLLTKFNKDEIQNVKRKFKTITIKFQLFYLFKFQVTAQFCLSLE